MCSKERKLSRSAERIRAWLLMVVWTVAETLESLFNLREEHTLKDKGVKTAGWFARAAIYFVLDHGINLVQVALAIAMKAWGLPLLAMFAGLWIFDLVAAGVFVIVHEVTGKDLTLGMDTRRAANYLRQSSRTLSFLVGVGNAILAIAWTGPERVIAFYREEIGSVKRLVLVLVVLTGIQAFLWTLLYSYAYDLVIKYL